MTDQLLDKIPDWLKSLHDLENELRRAARHGLGRAQASDAGANWGALDIAFDVFDTVDLTYLLYRAGEIPTLTDDAAQRHLPSSNGNLDTGTDIPFRPHR